MDKRTRGSIADARIVRSRAALRRAFIALLGERNFADITVAELVGRAGVGYATFFRHYPNKEALLAEIADSLIAELAQVMAPLVLAGNTAAAASALVACVEADSPLCRALLLGAGEPFRRAMIDRTLAMALAWPADEVIGALPRDLVARHLVSATLTVLGWWLQEPRAISSEQLRAIIGRLVIEPVGIEPQNRP